MPTERTIPGLPCRDLDDVLPFYVALGFEVTYRQERPNPFAAVRRGGIELHFFAVPEFDPADSMGSVVVLVPDTAALHTAFAAGLRTAFGKVPLAGIPRMTRPRAKQGVPRGFSVVDPGGNWLRISRYSDSDAEVEDQPGGSTSRLARAMAAAARQADSHGDEAAGVRVLENALARHTDAPVEERLPAMVFLAELKLRIGEPEAATALLAEIDAVALSPASRDTLAAELATAAELAAELRS